MSPGWSTQIAAVARAGTVMTMRANDAAIEAVVFGDGGLLAAGPDLLLTELIASRMGAIIAADGGEQDWSAIGQ